ncbi:MAG: sodium:alanine symporter family protein [Candidatus Marinimicrobia bacterium]|nr:sodium:alanine symporter family protein [Candidatus Neomarinimicrobiota bacterium]MCF7828166.1 sodium:alanine symporter family protein [Candidatus Neomarinimicrobiota bacterium]MCF7879659.1 sodium:alanine symporter family protein [Candidatus Neomarinimicrobiota bacterium]
MVIILVGTGIFLTFRLGFPQFRLFRHAWRVIAGHYDNPDDEGDINHFEALSAALSATIGIGNIAGVATAVHWGGPGVLFWMWITALFGMATKFTTCTLSHKYRTIHGDGTASGGPMYSIERGLGAAWKPLGITFAALVLITSLGIPNLVQSNTVAVSLHRDFGVPPFITGLVLAGLVGVVIVGGIRRIGRVASRLVPFMAAIYVIGAVIIIAANYQNIIPSIILIFENAFTPTAQMGGFFGSAWIVTLTWGIKRGLFSNEAGLGSAPIAHAAAKTKESVREGVVAMIGPFIDTLIICTLTGLVLVTTGVWQEKFDEILEGAYLSELTVYAGEITPNSLQVKEPYSGTITVKDGAISGDFSIYHETGTVDNYSFLAQDELTDYSDFSGTITIQEGQIVSSDPSADLAVSGEVALTGAELTAQGFSRGLPGRWGNYIVSIGVILFAFSTALAWSYYGDRSIEYIVGRKGILPYRIIFVIFIFLGSLLTLNTVWLFSDIAMALMAIPNLLATLGLVNKVADWTKLYTSVKHPEIR